MRISTVALDRLVREMKDFRDDDPRKRRERANLDRYETPLFKEGEGDIGGSSPQDGPEEGMFVVTAYSYWGLPSRVAPMVEAHIGGCHWPHRVSCEGNRVEVYAEEGYAVGVDLWLRLNPPPLCSPEGHERG